MELTLFGNRESGHSYKVALMLTLARVPFEFVAVDLAQPRELRGDAFVRASRFGEVPALVIDGRAMVQSNAILATLSERLGMFAPDRAGALEWLFWESNRIGLSLPNLRWIRRVAPETPREVSEWLEARCRADLARLDAELADGRCFLMGDALSIADISCCGYLFWLDQVELDRADWPNVDAWLDRISQLGGWRHPYELMAASGPR